MLTPPQTRRLLVLLDELVRRSGEQRGLSHDEVRLTRKEDPRPHRLGSTQLAVHLARLCELEYVAAYGGGRGRTAAYELIWPGANEGVPSRKVVASP